MATKLNSAPSLILSHARNRHACARACNGLRVGSS